MLRIGKVKGKFEEPKGWNLPNNLYIKGIYSTIFVILKISVLNFSFQLLLLDPDVEFTAQLKYLWK